MPFLHGGLTGIFVFPAKGTASGGPVRHFSGRHVATDWPACTIALLPGGSPMFRRQFLITLAAIVLAAPAVAQTRPADWDAVLKAARGQTVYWHAWAGADRTHAFIQCTGEQMAQRCRVTIQHWKLRETAQTRARVGDEEA